MAAATLSELLKTPLGVPIDLLQYAGFGLLVLSVLIAYVAVEQVPG